MNIDVPLVAAFIYIFVKENIFGWGLLQDYRFIVFAILVVLGYLLADVFLSLTQKAWLRKVKIFLLLFFILFLIFGVSTNIIALRRVTHPATYINDSALQTEIAGRFLLLKINPYVESYTETDLAKWPYRDEASKTLNPALFVNVTPPLMIVGSAVGFRIFSQVAGWFDIRILILTGYLLLLLIGYLKFGLKNRFLLFLTLVCLNPIFLLGAISGSNDVVVLVFLLGSLLLLEKKKYTWSGFLLGAAVACKQSAWFAVPFFLLFVWQQAKRKDFRRFFLAGLAMILLFYLPFLVWNPVALFNNLVFYVTGSSSGEMIIHPIEGYGFGQLLLAWGKLETIYDQFPFGIIQLILGVGLILFLLFLQRKKMAPAGLLASYAASLSVVWFFNRYFLETHVSYLLVLYALSFLWSKNQLKK